MSRLSSAFHELKCPLNIFFYMLSHPYSGMLTWERHVRLWYSAKLRNFEFIHATALESAGFTQISVPRNLHRIVDTCFEIGCRSVISSSVETCIYRKLETHKEKYTSSIDAIWNLGFLFKMQPNRIVLELQPWTINRLAEFNKMPRGKCDDQIRDKKIETQNQKLGIIN